MAERVQFAADGSVQAALNKIRNTVTGDYWLVIGYEGKNTLIVVADGEGGLEAAKAHLPATECRYVLLRKDWKVEISRTVKFAFIDWTPSGLPPTRRALLTTHKGQLREMLGQTHVTHQASDPHELDETAINDKIGVSAGTKSLVTDKAAWTHESKAAEAHAKAAAAAPSKRADAHLVPSAVVHATTGVRLVDEAEVKAAIAEVRRDNIDTNWLLLSYADDTSLRLAGKGSGGVEELASRLDAKECYYAFFRTSVVQDKTTKVIFCSLKLLSMAVSTVARAKITTHKGFVDGLFSPVHTEFSMNAPEEFTPEAVSTRVAAITLTASHVVASGGADHVSGTMLHRPKTETKAAPAPHVPTGSSGALAVEDDEKFRAALASVKSDGGGNNWFVCRWAAKDTLGLVAAGNGATCDAFVEHLQDDINFAFLRIINRVDKTDAVKFVLVKYQPEGVSAIKKGQVGAKKGDIENFFRPFHVSLQAATKAELTAEHILDLVTAAAGTKSHVLPSGARGSVGSAP